MTRRNDIFEKLDYADSKYNELCCQIFSAGLSKTKVKFLSSLTSEILTSSREVFDYCAKDILDHHIVPNDPAISAVKASKAIKCYYPFYKGQLIKKNNVFFKLKSINRPLYNHLFSIAASIEKAKTRPNTLFNYGELKELADMVNEKKHDKLLVVEANKTGSIYAENDGLQMIMPLAEQIGISYIVVSPDANHTLGNQYVFELNKKDILKFSMNCKNLTRLIMTEIYEAFMD